MDRRCPVVSIVWSIMVFRFNKAFLLGTGVSPLIVDLYRIFVKKRSIRVPC